MWFVDYREPLIAIVQFARRFSHSLSAPNASDLLP